MQTAAAISADELQLAARNHALPLRHSGTLRDQDS